MANTIQILRSSTHSATTAPSSLENGEFGISFSSGMAATTSLFQMLNNGDHVIIHPKHIVSTVPTILQLIVLSKLLNLVTFILLLYFIVTVFGFASSANGAYK